MLTCSGRNQHSLLPGDGEGYISQTARLTEGGNGEKVIDIAQRVAAIREGDTVEFFGEYEWNSKGGVVHWTHHDPGGRHKVGWLKHKGSVYQ